MEVAMEVAWLVVQKGVVMVEVAMPEVVVRAVVIARL